jgi:hypothetical protein
MPWSEPRRFLRDRDPALLAPRGSCGSFRQSARLRWGGLFSSPRERSSIEAKLFADRLCKRVFDLRVSRDRRYPTVNRVGIEIMIRTVTFQVAAAFSEAAHQLPPFHSEIAISCLSLGTNVLSAASSTIKRYASRIIA